MTVYKVVLIPSRSGLLSNPLHSASLHFLSLVLIPSRSGLLSNRDRSTNGATARSLNPFSIRSAFKQAAQAYVDDADCLNPFSIRSAFKRKEVIKG